MMAQVEHKPEAVLGSLPVEVHNRVNYNRNHNKVNNNKAPELLHLLLPPKAPTNPNSHLPNDRLPHDCFRHSHLLHDCLPKSRLLASLDNGFMRKMIIVKIRTAQATFFIFFLLA
jgi:hypothetical protein